MKAPWLQTRPVPNVNSVVIPLPAWATDSRSPREIARMISIPTAVGTSRRSLTASAEKLDRDELRKIGKGETWQDEAWACYEQVGELHFAANAHANAVSRLVMELVRTDENQGDAKLGDLQDTELTDVDRVAMLVLEDLGGDSPTGLAELMRLSALNLFVVGEVLLVGTPDLDYQDAEEEEEDPAPVVRIVKSPLTAEEPENPGLPLASLHWRALSVAEVKVVGTGVKICGKLYSADEIVAIRIHNPHPRNSKIADSPVRAALPILRELVGLTMHISATIDSRLAGAGAFVMPQSTAVLGYDVPEEDPSVNPVAEAIMETMLTPIKDRDSAAAIVPVFLTVPDDTPFQPYHMTFATPFDASAKDLRDEAIRRLALSLDMPPEVLLGMGDSSHWNAWQVQEENVRTSVLPTGWRLADAWAREYLRPAMVEQNIDAALAANYSLLPDPSALIDRPNQHAEALALFQAGALGVDALLDASGFRAEDNPLADADPAIQLALRYAMANPMLLSDPGLPALVGLMAAALDGSLLSAAPTVDDIMEEAEPEPVPPALEQAPAVAEEGPNQPGPPDQSPAGNPAAG